MGNDTNRGPVMEFMTQGMKMNEDVVCTLELQTHANAHDTHVPQVMTTCVNPKPITLAPPEHGNDAYIGYSNTPHGNAPYPFSYRPPHSAYLNGLRQDTQRMNTYVAHHAAMKGVDKINAEDMTATTLCVMEQQLIMRPVTPLEYGPPQQLEVRLPHLPQDMINIVLHIAAQTMWPPFLILLALLGAIAIAMKGRYRLRLDDDWSEPIMLFLLIAASSGMRKSQVVSILRRVFEEFVNQQQAAYFTEIHERKNCISIVRKMEKESIKLAANTILFNHKAPSIDSINAMLSSAKSIAQNIALLSKAIEIPQAPPNMFVDDITPKKLAMELAAQGESLAIFSAEDGMLGGTLKRYAEAARILLVGYTMEPYADSSLTREDVTLRNPAMNIVYVVQEKVLAELYGNETLISLGLVPRFLPCFYNGAHWYPDTSGVVDGKSAMNVYQEKISKMLERNFTQERDRHIYECCVTPDAYGAIKGFEQQINEWMQHGNGLHMESFMRKLHGSAARLAGVLHAWNHERPEDHPVSLGTMQIAIEIARALISHAAYAFNPDGLRAYKGALKIINWVRRHGKRSFNSREIAQGIPNMKNADIFPSLDLLEQHGILAQLIDPPHPRQCVLNPNFFNAYFGPAN